MRDLSRRERVIFVLTLAAFGGAVADRCVWSPVRAAWTRLDASVAALRAQLAEDERLLAESERVKTEYARYVPTSSKRSDAERLGSTGVLRELASLARKTGVKISDIRPQRVEGRSAQVATLLLWTESDSGALGKFIDQIHGSAHMVQIDKAHLQRKGDDAARLLAQFEISQRQDGISD